MAKVLIDPIPTAQPSKCASMYKMKNIVEFLLANYEDMFIYWRVPEDTPEEDWENWLPKDDRIMYLPVELSRDRHKEYHYVRENWNDNFIFRGDFWDIDLVITNRTTLASLIRLQMYRPNNHHMERTRKIVVFEDMPVMSFKKSVPIPHRDMQDRQTINGYLAADATAICAYWEKDEILKTARKFYSPAMLRQLRDTIFESSPVHIENTELKTTETIADTNRPFTIGFAGRMVLGHNFDAIFDVMQNHWIYRSGEDRPVECVISTVSKSDGKVKTPDFISVKRLGREDFWDLMKNKVDVGIFMSPEEDYSLSLLEPLILGTPYAVYEAPWSIASLGKDYPFFVKNATQAYAVIRGFYENYAKEYVKFAEWSKKHFQPLLRERNKVTHSLVVADVLTQHDKDLQVLRDTALNRPKELIQLLVDYGERNGGKINLQEAFTTLEAEGKVRHLAGKMRDNINTYLSFSTDFNEFRIALQVYGYVDATLEAGTFIKKT